MLRDREEVQELREVLFSPAPLLPVGSPLARHSGQDELLGQLHANSGGEWSPPAKGSTRQHVSIRLHLDPPQLSHHDSVRTRPGGDWRQDEWAWILPLRSTDSTRSSWIGGAANRGGQRYGRERTRARPRRAREYGQGTARAGPGVPLSEWEQAEHRAFSERSRPRLVRVVSTGYRSTTRARAPLLRQRSDFSRPSAPEYPPHLVSLRPRPPASRLPPTPLNALDPRPQPPS